MGDELRLPIRNENDVVVARREARDLAARQGMEGTDLTLLATAISEIARNITTYAGSGDITIEAVNSGRRRGVRVVASDNGPGIVNLDLALRDGYTTGRGLGLGLPGARRLVDDFEVETEVGKGTRVTLIKWGRET
jgi:serine/threonine-protein kinase RsbT